MKIKYILISIFCLSGIKAEEGKAKQDQTDIKSDELSIKDLYLETVSYTHLTLPTIYSV